jgi:hypothetical protein
LKWSFLEKFSSQIVFSLQLIKLLFCLLAARCSISECEVSRVNARIVFPLFVALSLGLAWAEAPRHLQASLSPDKAGTEEWKMNWQGCSLACGLPWVTQASSTLPHQSHNTYSAAMAQDADFRTAWVEGAPGDGVGEYLQCTFAGEAKGPVNFSGVSIASGYQKSAASWKDNGRPKQLLLQVNGQEWARLDLQDTQAVQFFEVRNRVLKVGDKMRLVIESVYPGERFHDTAITEFTLAGGH